MIKTEKVVINGVEYSIATFDAIRGNLILFKLLKFLRGGSKLLNDLSGAKDFFDNDLALGDVLEQILGNMDPEEMNTFVVMLMKNTSMNGKMLTEDIIKHHFAGNYFDMYKLLISIIKVNYFNEGTASFFADARNKMAVVSNLKKEAGPEEKIKN